jgi:hypothetical protein
MHGLFDKHKNSMKNGEAKKLPVNSLGVGGNITIKRNYKDCILERIILKNF